MVFLDTKRQKAAIKILTANRDRFCSYYKGVHYMQITPQNGFSTSQPMIWFEKRAFPFGAVESFTRTAEEARRKHPIVLYALLDAARNRESIKTHGDLMPQDHVWMTSFYEEAVALLLGPIFYRMKISTGTSHGIAVPREDVLESFRFEFETHREMLKLLLQGIH